MIRHNPIQVTRRMPSIIHHIKIHISRIHPVKHRVPHHSQTALRKAHDFTWVPVLDELVNVKRVDRTKLVNSTQYDDRHAVGFRRESYGRGAHGGEEGAVCEDCVGARGGLC